MGPVLYGVTFEGSERLTPGPRSIWGGLPISLYATARGAIKNPPTIPRARSDRIAAVFEGCFHRNHMFAEAHPKVSHSKLRAQV